MASVELTEVPKKLWRIGSAEHGVATIREPVIPPSAEPGVDEGGYRWDDPDCEFGLLYAATHEVVAVAEVIAPVVRPIDEATSTALALVDGLDSATYGRRQRDRAMLRARSVIDHKSAVVLDIADGTRAVDVALRSTRVRLAEQFADECDYIGMDVEALEADGLRTCNDRAITRPMGAWLHAEFVSGGDASGIGYRSRWSAEGPCWAMDGEPGARPACVVSVGAPVEVSDSTVANALRLVVG